VRIAWFSPLPPIPSGIGDYSFELLPLIAEQAAIDVFCPASWRGARVEAPPGTALCPPESFEGRSAVYDAVFHHLGNNPHHDFVYDAARRHPGIAVFHDVVMHHLLADDLGKPRKRRRYDELLRSEYGDTGDRLRVLALRGVNTDFEKFLFPLNATVARRAKAIVVHSEDAGERVAEVAPHVPVIVIPHYAGRAPSPLAGVTRAEARDRLGLPPEAFLVGQFGFLTRPKQPVAVIDGFARLKVRFPDARLLVVGQNEAGPGLTQFIDTRGLGASVDLTGYVDLDRLYLYLKAVDVVVSLRYPSAGETSGTGARALAEGRALIVNDLGAFAELPADVVLKVEVDGDQAHQVGEHLIAIAQNANLKRSLEDRARTYARTVLDPARCARLYLDAAGGARASRPRVTLSSSQRYPFNRLRNSCSSIVSTPSSTALSYFDPGFSPTTTKSVFFDTLEAIRAPASCAARSASVRDIASRPPVMTIVVPVSGPSGCAASGSSSTRRPAFRNRSTSLRLSGSWNQAWTLRAISGPISSTAPSSSSEAAASASIDGKARERTCATCEPT